MLAFFFFFKARGSHVPNPIYSWPMSDNDSPKQTVEELRLICETYHKQSVEQQATIERLQTLAGRLTVEKHSMKMRHAKEITDLEARLAQVKDSLETVTMEKKRVRTLTTELYDAKNLVHDQGVLIRDALDVIEALLKERGIKPVENDCALAQLCYAFSEILDDWSNLAQPNSERFENIKTLLRHVTGGEKETVPLDPMSYEKILGKSPANYRYKVAPLTKLQQLTKLQLLNGEQIDFGNFRQVQQQYYLHGLQIAHSATPPDLMEPDFVRTYKKLEDAMTGFKREAATFIDAMNENAIEQLASGRMISFESKIPTVGRDAANATSSSCKDTK